MIIIFFSFISAITMHDMMLMHLEPSKTFKCLCPPCSIYSIEGCSDVFILCCLSMVCYPLNGIIATKYTTRPHLQMNIDRSIQKGYIFPPPNSGGKSGDLPDITSDQGAS